MFYDHCKYYFTAILWALCVTFNTSAQAQQSISQHFDAIRRNLPELTLFLEQMPKGGDLHNHLSGAAYAENLIQYSNHDPYCVDPKSYILTDAKPCNGVPLSTLPLHSEIYNHTIDAWSMRHFIPGRESGHDHFFAVFNKVGKITHHHRGQLLAEVVNRAGRQHIHYMELMIAPDNYSGIKLGKSVQPTHRLATLDKNLRKRDINRSVKQAQRAIDRMERIKNRILHCNNKHAQPGCQVQIRYLFQIVRLVTPAQVYAQMQIGFRLADTDPRVVGINLVGAEDDYYAVHDYHWQMLALRHLHQRHPHVHISLHAGELAPQLVRPIDLRSHIAQAVYLGGAQRIGHGVDIAYEDHAEQLLDTMAARHIPVEVNLSSNRWVLGITAGRHPFPLYRTHHVPIVLSTDDEGIFRTDLTREYAQAIQHYQLSYDTVKQINRNSLTYSFLPGESLWNDTHIASACAHAWQNHMRMDTNCQQFIAQSEKARLQWQLEKNLFAFEQTALNQPS